MIAFDNSRVYLSIGGAPLMYLIIRDLIPKFYSKCDILQEKHHFDCVILQKIVVQTAIFCKKYTLRLRYFTKNAFLLPQHREASPLFTLRVYPDSIRELANVCNYLTL